LYHWNTEITYNRLPIKKIEQSIENADVLNCIAEQKSIDTLVSEALQVNMDESCTCDICEFVRSML